MITRESGPDWSLAPDWVHYWAAEQNGISWFWEHEPILHEEGYWLPEGGFTPVFAGMVVDAALWWHESKLKGPEKTEGILGDPPEVIDAESD